MGIFVCDNCEKTFKYKKNLTYHTDNTACKDRNFSCKYCNKELASESSMYRHMRDYCLIKKQQDGEKDQIYVRLLKTRRR